MSQIQRITPIRLARLNNDEYAQFLRSTANLITTASLERLHIEKELFDRFKVGINLLTETTHRTRSSKETKALQVLDKKRNQLVSFLLSSFRLERKSPISLRSEAGLSLYQNTKNYIGAQKSPIRQKSHIIDSLIKELDKPHNARYIQDLGLSSVINDLAKYNSEYQNLTFERAENQVESSGISIVKLRKEVDTIYEDMMTWAFAMSLISPSPEVKNFIVLQNKLIEDTIVSYKLRMGVSSAKSEEGENTGE